MRALGFSAMFRLWKILAVLFHATQHNLSVPFQIDLMTPLNYRTVEKLSPSCAALTVAVCMYSLFFIKLVFV